MTPECTEERVATTPDFTARHGEWVERPERLHDRFLVSVKGTDSAGEKFKATTRLENIGEGGLYVRLAERVEIGARLTAEVFITGGAASDLIFYGEVVRSEPLIDLRHGAAVRFDRHQVVTD